MLQFDSVIFNLIDVALPNLRPPRDSRQNEFAIFEFRIMFFGYFQRLDVFRPRTDDAHIPLDDVPELGKFIEMIPAQETPEWIDSRVVFLSSTWFPAADRHSRAWSGIYRA